MGKQADIDQLFESIRERIGEFGDEGLIVLLGPDRALLDGVLAATSPGHLICVFDPYKRLPTDDDRVRYVHGSEFTWLDEYHRKIVNGQYIVIEHTPTVNEDKLAFNKFRNELEARKSLTMANVSTTIGLGATFIDMYLKNIPRLASGPGVKILAGCCAGASAVIISAGPSLERAADDLRAIKGHALLIAADAALPFLARAGIKPDIIAGIDPLDNNAGFFGCCPRTMLERAFLICLAQYTPDVIASYPGPVFIAEQPGNILHGWLSHFWDDKGWINTFGGSVSHYALSIAEHLGCSQAILVGNDLCFGERYYSPGIGEALNIDQTVDPRTRAIEMANMDGDTVWTTPTLLAFRTAFELHLRTAKIKVYNGSIGGLPISGTDPLSVAQFMCNYGADVNCAHPSPIIWPPLLLYDTASTWDRSGLRKELIGAINLYESIRGRTMQAKKVTAKIAKRLRNHPGHNGSGDVHDLVRMAARINNTISHPMLRLIGMYNYNLELYLARADTQGIDDITDRNEMLTRQAQRNSAYYAELIRSLDQVVPRLRDLSEELK